MKNLENKAYLSMLEISFFIFLCFMVLNRLNRQIDNMLGKHAIPSLPTPIPLNNLPQTNKSPQFHHYQAYDDDETQS